MNAKPNIVFWRVGPRLCRVQTTSREHAKRLRRRSDARLVAWGYAGDFQQTFELPRQPWFMRNLVARYVRREAPTKGADPNANICPGTPSLRLAKEPEGSNTSEDRSDAPDAEPGHRTGRI